MPDVINPDAIPGKDLLPDVIDAHAAQVNTIAASVRDNGSNVHLKWQGMAGVYSAPESETLLGLMQPVSSQATVAGDNLQVVASALIHFAADARPIKAELDSLRLQAQAFVDGPVTGGVRVRELNPAWISTQNSYGGAAAPAYSSPSTGGTAATATADIPQYRSVHKDWHEDQDTVDRNNELINAVNAQQVLLWEAERACANKIRDLYGAQSLRAATSENDPLGYMLDEIPEGTEMPWGAPVERTEGCGETTLNFVVKDFLWEGILVGGVWGTVQGLGTLAFGYNPATGEFFSGDAYGAAWGNLGMLAAGAAISATPPLSLLFMADDIAGDFGGGFLPDEVRDFKNSTDEAWLNTGKALIAWDKWQDDPGTALGESVFNVGTLLIPVGGAAVAGVKTASTAASVLSKATQVVNFIDPAALLTNGALRVGGMGVGALDNLIGKLDAVKTFESPNLDVYTAMDSASALRALDDWGVDLNTVTARVDSLGNDVLELPGGRIEMAEGSFDNAAAGIRGADGGADAAAPAVVREPELVSAGGVRGETGPAPVNSIVDDAPVRTETGGGGTGGSTVVREPEGGAGSGGAASANDSGSNPTGDSSSNGSDSSTGGSFSDSPTDAGSHSAPQANNFVIDPHGVAGNLPRMDGPLYGSAVPGPHDDWIRIADENPTPADYGLPQAAYGDPPAHYERPGSVSNPDVRKLIENPSAPYGWDEHGVPLNRDQWNERYALPNKPDGTPDNVRWPGNDGAMPGTRVEYTSMSSLLTDYPEFASLDRLGRESGDYLTVGGTPFEQRGLTPGHTGYDFRDYAVTGRLPTGVQAEISVIAPAHGFPGGGWQIKFRDAVANKFLSVADLGPNGLGILS